MAIRPIFIAKKNEFDVQIFNIEFNWYPGMSKSQKQKSIKDLHSHAQAKGITEILEVSSKSEKQIGINLSAFNLTTQTLKKGKTFSVETAFQSSKVFKNGGPYIDLLYGDSRAAKKDPRIKNSGPLIGFKFFGRSFPIKPTTFFYDWLYINTLNKNQILIPDVLNYNAFTDIEFNPKKSINCQAFSIALFVSLFKNELITDAISSPEKFMELTKEIYNKREQHLSLQGKFI